MSRDIEDLIPAFKPKVQQVLLDCEAEGILIVPTHTVRSVVEQAILWRRSRSADVISRKVQFLYDRKADFLAEILRDVGPRNGNWATNALPGESWHQWGEGFDGAWKVDGKIEWSTDRLVNGVNGYRRYAQIAQGHGLTSLGSIGDWAHIQLRPGKVTDQFTWKEINDRMKERFG